MSLPGLLARSVRRGEPIDTASWWVTLLPLALLLASDYKLRSRPPDQTIGGGADLTVLVEIAVYAAVGGYLYLRFGLRAPIRRTSGLMLAVWAWSGYLAMSASWSIFPKLAVVRAAELLVVMALCQVLATRATAIEMRRFAHAFIVVVMASVLIGVVHPFPRTHLTKDRFNWLYVHPVQAGVYLGIAIMLTVSFLIRREPADRGGHQDQGRLWPPVVYGGCLLVLLGALVATGTRGAALGAAVGIVVLLATARGPRGRADLLVLGVVGVTITVLAFSKQILGFATRGESAEQLKSLNSRTELWDLAFKKFAEEPLFGYGLGGSRGLFLRDIGLGGGHNAFVNAMVDNGAVGLVVFTSLLLTLAVVLLGLVRHVHLRQDAGLLLGLLAFFITDSMTMEGLAVPANVAGTWLFLLVAWTEVVRRGRSTRAVTVEISDAPPAAQVHDAAQQPDQHQRPE